MSRSRRSASSRPRRRRKCWASRSTPSSRSPAGRGRWPTISGQMVLNRTWRPQLAVIGMDGYPAPGDAGNVLLPYSTAQLSLRMPPTLDAEAAVQAMKQTLEADPPHGAEVTFDGWEGQSGWHAPPLAPWLETAVARGLAGGVRPARGLHGRRRLDPLHGHAGREVPGHAVRHHRRAGAALQCARAQRVSAHPDGQARDHGHGPPDRGALRPGHETRELGLSPARRERLRSRGTRTSVSPRHASISP